MVSSLLETVLKYILVGYESMLEELYHKNENEIMGLEDRTIRYLTSIWSGEWFKDPGKEEDVENSHRTEASGGVLLETISKQVLVGHEKMPKQSLSMTFTYQKTKQYKTFKLKFQRAKNQTIS